MRPLLLLHVLAALAVPALVGPAPSEAQTPPPPDKDCADFSSQEEAQAYFVARGPGDPDRLDGDGDGDGIACDSLPTTAPPPPAPGKSQTIRARITAVTDGDTIKVRTTNLWRKRYTVRLIGIDTPETKKPDTPVECGGREATSNMLRHSFAKSRDTDGDGLRDRPSGRGRTVTLKTDPTQGTRDQFGRLLAYASTSKGSLALAQLSAGWADLFVYATSPFARVDSFRAAAEQARYSRRGSWSLCVGSFHAAR